VLALIGARWRGSFARYCTVGASGYAVNSGLFLLFQRMTPYPVAFALAFATAATSNFALNRRASPQYLRFLAVSLGSLAIDLLVLVGLVEGAGSPRFAAAAVAILVATPAGYLANRLWTFPMPAAPAQLRTATMPSSR
jgi:putative flippase GtrA